MNKNHKPVNNSFREHWKIHGHLSPTMIEELLDLVDDRDAEITELIEAIDDLNADVEHAHEEIADLNAQV